MHTAENRGTELTGLSDEVLVQLAQASNTSAFAVLVERHRKSALRTAGTILRNREDAEDEVQNAFWRAFEHIEQFEGGSKFNTWLTRIVVNQCLMRLRRNRRVHLVGIEDHVYESSARTTLPQTSALPDRELTREQIRRVVRDEVHRIPQILREPLVLRHLQELPMCEVAKRLGITVPAAKSRLIRARNELQIRLEKHQGRIGPASLVA